MPNWRRYALNVEPLREHRDFRLIFWGQIVNNAGSQVTQVALPYQLYLLTGSALALGAMATAQLVAVLVFSPIAGAVVDAVDRRSLLRCTQTGLLCVSASLAALAVTHTAQPWHLFALAFVQAVLNGFERPGRQAIIPRLVSRELLTPAIALNQVGGKTAMTVGPALGWLLIASAGPGLAYGIDAATYVGGLLVLLLIAPIPPMGVVAKGPRAIVDGLRYVRGVPALLAAFAVDIDAMVFGMPTALFPILALNVFHDGAQGLGLLVSAPAVGAVIAALTSGWVHHQRYPGRVVVGAVIVWGVSIALFGLMPSLGPALVLLAVAGGADAVSAMMRWTIVQLAAPDSMQGRVTAMNTMVVNAGPRLGDIEATGVAALFNAQVSVVSGGLLCLFGLAFVVKFFPELTRYDMTDSQPALVATAEPALAV